MPTARSGRSTASLGGSDATKRRLRVFACLGNRGGPSIRFCMVPIQLPAKAWVERGRLAEAEAAFDEAVKARPADGMVILERGRFHASRSHTAKAAKDFAQALMLGALDDLQSTILDNSEMPDMEKGTATRKP